MRLTQSLLLRNLSSEVFDSHTTQKFYCSLYLTNLNSQKHIENRSKATWYASTPLPASSTRHFGQFYENMQALNKSPSFGTCHYKCRTENEQIWRDPLACSRNRKTMALTKLTTLPTFTSSSKSRATGGEGTPMFSAATWRSTKLTSSNMLVCWQPVNKATANSFPWCSWAGGTHIRLTHQGSSSWCAV